MSRCYSRMAQLGLLLIGAALVLDCIALALDISLGRRIVAGQDIAEASLARSSQLSGAANLAVPAAILLGGLVFVWWFHCAYHRASLMQGTSYSHVWAAISWFVPGINLVRPPQIMIELTARAVATSAWWALWAIGAVVQVALRFIEPATQQGWVYWQTTALVANLILLASLALAFMLVSTVSQMAKGRSRYWRPDSAPIGQPPKLTAHPADPSMQQPDPAEWAAPATPMQPMQTVTQQTPPRQPQSMPMVAQQTPPRQPQTNGNHPGRPVPPT